MWKPNRLLASLATSAIFTFCPSSDNRVLEAASGSVGTIQVRRPAHHVCLEQQYRRAWILVDRNYMRRDRLAAWRSWEHRYDGKLMTAADLECAVETMVCSLGDEYTYVRSEGLTTARKAQQEGRNTVSHRVLTPRIGYLKIDSFLSKHVVEETAAALGKLAQVRGLILDLRGNIGGGIDEAVAVFSLLSQEGKIASFRGWFDGSGFTENLVLAPHALIDTFNTSTFENPRGPCLWEGKPIVVLVDENTRSAAELLAGALHDSRSAKIVGTKTFGKGVIQKSWELSSGISIKLVIARYYLPSGSCIDGAGIVPDLTVEQAPGDRQLMRAAGLLAARRAG